VVSGALALDVLNEFDILAGHDIHTFINPEQVRRDAFTKMTNNNFSLWETTISDVVSNYRRRDMAVGYSNTPFVHNLDRSLETPDFIYDIL